METVRGLLFVDKGARYRSLDEDFGGFSRRLKLLRLHEAPHAVKREQLN